MAFGGAGLGAAGTRVTKRLGIDDEVWIYIIQAVIGAAALNLILTLLLFSYLIIGWGSMIPFLSFSGFLVALFVIALARPQWMPIRVLIGNFWGIGAAVGALLGHKLYGMLQHGLVLIGKQFKLLGSLPWWVYCVLCLFCLVLALYKHWRISVAILCLSPVAGLVALTDGKAWLEAWHNLKWLIIPYSWPVIGFSLLLALVMGKEMLFPSLEWTFQPVSLEDLREVGLVGLWFPRLMSREPPEAIQHKRQVEVKVISKNGAQTKFPILDDSDKARAFYAAIKRDETFAERTALKYGLSRAWFNNLRELLFQYKLADWKKEEDPQQGIDLFDAGKKTIVAAATTPPPPGTSRATSK